MLYVVGKPVNAEILTQHELGLPPRPLVLGDRILTGIPQFSLVFGGLQKAGHTVTSGREKILYQLPDGKKIEKRETVIIVS